MVGLSFAARSTILPAFAAELGAPNLVIGAIPAVMTVGWLLPSLFAAGRTVSLARKFPFVLRYTVWERAPFLVLALAAFFLATPAPELTLALLLILLLVITGAGGVVMPAWMDIVGRAIPANLRGRFFAVAGLTGNVGGFLGSFATAYILAALAAPASYGVCFLISAFFMGLSYLALRFTREPETAVAQPVVPLRTYLARVPALLRGNRNLSWFLTAQAFDVVGMMSNGFYTVYALRTHSAPASRVGVFTTLLLSGEIAGNLVLGWLADRAGHRLVIITGAAATVAANVVALVARSAGPFGVVFGLVGLELAAIHVSNLNILLEFAPAAAEQATYIGLGNTLLAPVTFAAPLLAGMMADTLGFESLFSVAALSGVIGLALLVLRVRDPRHERAIRA